LLPDEAGSVKVKVIKVWKPEIFSTTFVVELPAWEAWTRKLGDSEARGIAPTTLTMWAPHEAVLLNDASIARIQEALRKGLESATAHA
jgi:hypothetical protein